MTPPELSCELRWLDVVYEIMANTMIERTIVKMKTARLS